VHRAEHSEVAAAPVGECFEAVLDFAAYPEWSASVLAADVIESGPESRVVEFRVDAKVRHIRYVLRYFWEEPVRVWWDYVEGDARDVSGEYRFEALDRERTRLTYRLAIDPGRFVPGPVKRVLTDTVMRGSVKDLKTRVERG